MQSLTMTLFEFKSLDISKQADALLKRGVYLINRLESGYEVMLYEIEGFYTEVWINKENHKAERIGSFLGTEPLQPYLKNIDITGLF